MLLFLLKHLRPCLSNLLHELAKSLDKANNAAFKELLCIINFVLSTGRVLEGVDHLYIKYYGTKVHRGYMPVG